jgi:serine/threonine protein kinase
MISCVVPWSGHKCTTLVALLQTVQQFRAPQLPPNLTQEMRCLLTSCLSWTPESRPTAQELLLYDSCSAVACPVCTHSCPLAQLTHTGGRVSAAYTDVASEFNYHQGLSSDCSGYHEELSSLAYSSSNSSDPTPEEPKAIVLSQNSYSERVRRAVSAPASGCTTSLESTSK